MPKLVALLVGINAYQPPISKLKGCVNDVAKMATYLHSLTAHFEAIDILTLTDEQADKTNLVTQFQDHLSKAQTDDVALFYYAGHGAQEHADLALWPHESDGRLECLVCHDNQLLADKELRWLFAHLSQNSAHIVSIFDCCHAGDNVRASVPTDKSVTVRQALPTDRSIRAFPKREWADFIFHREIDPDELVEKGIASIFPDENFIQLAACSNTQLAAEVSDGGVFTSALLQFLTSSTKILAYYDLSQRVSKLISHEFDQTPQAYVASSHQGHEAIFRGFLNLPADQKSSFYGN
ncbi:MAG: caspase family protein, partial [Flammeovirgaceae bacterium]